MKRQAAAVFAAIVAVGIGPAIWLGSNLFRDDPASVTPVPASTQATIEPTSDVTDPTEPEPAESPAESDAAEELDDAEGLDPDGIWTPGMKVKEPVPQTTEDDSTHPPAVG